MFEEIVKNKKPDADKLLEYGFVNDDGILTLYRDISDGAFSLCITFDADASEPDTVLIERDTGEEYTLYKTDAQGSFVGGIRSEIADILIDIYDKCCEHHAFRSSQANTLTAFLHEKYGNEAEFLWEKFPDCAIWRRQDNRKWYAALLTVRADKLGIASHDTVEIVDLRTLPEEMDSLMAKDGYYPGWHMNKKTWFAILLDGSVSDDELFDRVTESYNLANK